MNCVYEHRCTVTGKSYIGKTSRTAKQRLAKHFVEAKAGSKKVFHRALLKHGVAAFTTTIHAQNLSHEDACALERELISRLRTRSPAGYNLTDGGEGVLGHRHSEETRAKLRASHLGKRDSETTLARKSAAHANRSPLVDAINRQNQAKVRRDSETGVLGVGIDKRRGLYTANIRIDRVPHFLGHFNTIAEASAAYLAAKRVFHPLWRQPGAV